MSFDRRKTFEKMRVFFRKKKIEHFSRDLYEFMSSAREIAELNFRPPAAFVPCIKHRQWTAAASVFRLTLDWIFRSTPIESHAV